MVGYNVQTAVDAETHLIVAHDVTNQGHDRDLLVPMAKAASGPENTGSTTDFDRIRALAISPFSARPLGARTSISNRPDRRAGRRWKCGWTWLLLQAFGAAWIGSTQ